MPEASLEKVLTTLRGILSKTVERGCSEHEATMAANVAKALLDKYNLTIEEVMNSDPDAAKEEIVHIYVHIPVKGKTRVEWAIEVGEALALLYGVRAKGYNDWRRFAVTGFPADVEVWKMVFPWIIEQMLVLTKEAAVKYKAEGGKRHGNEFRPSFLWGLGQGVSLRIWDMWRDNKKATDAENLQINAIIRRKDDEISHYLSEKYGWYKEVPEEAKKLAERAYELQEAKSKAARMRQTYSIVDKGRTASEKVQIEYNKPLGQ